MEISKTEFRRGIYENLSENALAYSLYKFSEAVGYKSFRVSDLYEQDAICGPVAEFGIGKSDLETLLRTLNSANDRVLIAELNMGLDHITLRDDLNSLSVVEQML